GELGQLRHLLQRLPQRRGGERERAVLLEARAGGAIAVVGFGRRRRRRLFRRNVRGVLELGPGRQAGHLDDAGVAHVLLHAERVATGAGAVRRLLLVLVGEGDRHDEDRARRAHRVGEGAEPAVPAAVAAFLAPRHVWLPFALPPRRFHRHAGTSAAS